MVEMRKSEAKESEVNHRFAEHAHWYVILRCNQHTTANVLTLLLPLLLLLCF